MKGDTYTFPTSHSWPLYDLKHVHSRKFIHGFQLIKMRFEKNFEGWYLEIIFRNGKKFIYYFLFVWNPETRGKNIRTELPNTIYTYVVYVLSTKNFRNMAKQCIPCILII